MPACPALGVLLAVASGRAGGSVGDNSGQEREAVYSVGLAFARDMRWTFRDQPVDDYGIDAHIEPKRDGAPVGRLIAVQIKGGRSYFRTKAPGGWYYPGKDRHLRYWRNFVLPVVVILYDPDTETCYWQRVSDEHITYTASGWRLFVPASQTLCAEAAGPLLQIAESVPGAAEDPLQAYLSRLPPTTRKTLAEADKAVPAGALRLGSLLARGSDEPALTIQSLLAAQPSWWVTGQGRFDAVLATYAAEHGHTALTAAALARAVRAYQEPPALLLANAAYFAALSGDPEQAAEFAGRAEALGGCPLLCAVARGIAAHGNSRGLVAVPVPVMAASADELAAEPTVLLFLGERASAGHDFGSAVTHLERAHALLPDASGVAIGLAYALMGRHVSGKAVVTAADLRRAGEVAESALRQRREWSGPSGQALAVLIRLRMTSGAYETAIHMATPASLGGGAPDAEAAYGEVAVLGAEAAAIIGDRQRAAQFAGLVRETWAEPVIHALSAGPETPAPEQIALWRQALAVPLPPQQHAMALLKLAQLGTWPMPELDELLQSGSLDPVDYDVFTALNEAARGMTDTAVRRLRPHAARRSTAAEILIDILAHASRHDEVIAECDRAIGRFGADTAFLHKKLNALALAGRDDHAAALATRILSSPAAAPEVRFAIRRRLATECSDRRDWAGMEEHCSAAIAEGCIDAEFQWGLIGARYNQADMEAAWTRLTELRPAVNGPTKARLWITLHGRFGFTVDDVSTALDFLAQWPDDPVLATTFMGVILDANGALRDDGQPVLPELDPVTLHRFHTALCDYTAKYPDGPLQKGSADPETLAAMLREGATERAAGLNIVTAQIRAGYLPLAALAVASGWTYTRVLAECACGFIPAVTTDPATFEAEVKAARSALGTPAVIELSALAVATAIPGRWPSLVAAFAELKITRAAAADLEDGRYDLTRTPGTVLSVSYDPARDVLMAHQATAAEQHRLARRAQLIADAAKDATVTPNPHPVHFPVSMDPAWISSLELAAQAQAPLWSDDTVIRAIAAQAGIPAFGTIALLHALIEEGTLPDTLRHDAQALAAARVVDLVLTPEEITRLASADDWQPAAAAVNLSRPAFWICYNAALTTFLKVIDQVQQHQPDAVHGWLAAGCKGLAEATHRASAAERLRNLADATADKLGADPPTRAAMLQIADDVARWYTAL